MKEFFRYSLEAFRSVPAIIDTNLKRSHSIQIIECVVMGVIGNITFAAHFSIDANMLYRNNQLIVRCGRYGGLFCRQCDRTYNNMHVYRYNENDPRYRPPPGG